MQTVYIDVLLCVNLIINYLPLSAVGFYTHTKVTIRRLLSGAGVGAVCSLTILLPKLSFFPDTACSRVADCDLRIRNKTV